MLGTEEVGAQASAALVRLRREGKWHCGKDDVNMRTCIYVTRSLFLSCTRMGCPPPLLGCGFPRAEPAGVRNRALVFIPDIDGDLPVCWSVEELVSVFKGCLLPWMTITWCDENSAVCWFSKHSEGLVCVGRGARTWGQRGERDSVDPQRRLQCHGKGRKSQANHPVILDRVGC